MRIVKIARRPKSYWQDLYDGAPHMREAEEARQRAWLCQDFFGPVDSWEYWLRKKGFEAHDIFTGIAPMDDAWARENGFRPHAHAQELLCHRLSSLRPEVLVLEGIEGFTGEMIDRYRDSAPSIRLVAGWSGIDVRHHPSLKALDLFFTCMKDQARELTDRGLRTSLLPHAFDHRILDALGPREPPPETLNFVGNIISGAHMHDNRARAIEALVQQAGLRVYTNVEALRNPPLLRVAKLSAAYWSAVGLRALGATDSTLSKLGPIGYASKWPAPPAFGTSRSVRAVAQSSAFGLGMYRLLRRAATTFNMHVGFAGPYAANMRLFEATGAGVCLLTDERVDMDEYFARDEEVVTYGSIEEAVEKARWLSEHSSEAQAIGLRGQKRILREHTYEQRLGTVISEMTRSLARRG
jgi:hypothetical protein